MSNFNHYSFESTYDVYEEDRKDRWHDVYLSVLEEQLNSPGKTITRGDIGVAQACAEEAANRAYPKGR